ncbi:MAG: ribonuclease HI [Clostridiales bacterium]|nr:ribonuclease HI [Clostridiales bacterium]
MNEKFSVEMFTDGACSGNPGPGGWGTILRCKGKEKELCGSEKETTNNRMELTAVIEGLKALKTPCKVKITTDSKYVVDAITKGWAVGWRENGWKKKDKKPALNPDLWTVLLDELEKHEVEFIWVKGHAGHPENERCDTMAVKEYQKYL